jgi:predicted Zn-dependent peptidase
MKEIRFNKLDEVVYYEKIKNKIDLFLYPTEKTKNFYATFSVKYGAKVVSYSLENKDDKFTIIPGSAHFLEHKIMDTNYHKKEFEMINNLGSFSNAYTTYNGTNYNIFGSEDILTNLKILFDLVLNPKLNEKSVEVEKQIIGEEIGLYKDDIIEFMFEKLKNNLYFNDYPKNSVLGEKEDINNITYEGLIKVYKDFYNLNNMFIVVTGNFNMNEVVEYINNYFNKIKRIPKFKAKINKIKEPEDINISYEEITKDVEEPRVFIGYKLLRNDLPRIDDFKLIRYLNMIMSTKLGPTSELYEKYKNEKLIINLSYSVTNFDNYFVIIIEALTDNSKKYIENIIKDISKYEIDKETFERKKKNLISSLIMTFENIEDVEEIITSHMFNYNKVYNNSYDLINELNFKEVKLVEKSINYDKYSILKTIK